MLKPGLCFRFDSALLLCALACSLSLPAEVPHARFAVTNSDVELVFDAGAHAPKLSEIHGRWGVLRNGMEEVLPSSVETDGNSVPIQWQFRPHLSRATSREVVLVYETDNPHLRLEWSWKLRALFGPVEHEITVRNLSPHDVQLPLLDSLRLEIDYPPKTDLRNLYVEKGADSPSAVGTHLDTVADGYRWTGESSTYALPVPGQAREVIPLEMVFNAKESGWYAGIEFSGRTRLALAREGDHVRSALGLNPEPGPFWTRVLPGAAFSTPIVFLGAFSDGPDGAGNQLRPWVRSVLGNPLTWKDPHYPLTVNNSWGSGMQVDEKLALRMMEESKQLGLEMFHLDAGWFRGVGDWYPDPVKFPHGIASIADEAHRQGLRFGMWVDWTQAGLDTEPGSLNVHDPKVADWLVTDLPPNWKPEEFKGQTADLGVPAAKDYFEKEVDRIVSEDHLDMLEHDGYLVAKGCVRRDHPHAAPDRATMKVIHDWGSDFVVASNSTDVSYHAVKAYYEIYEQMRKEHPGLLFEICNDGGRMVDFGSAAHGDYFSITDTYDPLSNRRAFFDASHVLPAAMLESYVEKWPAPSLENFLYMLRSGMMGWITIMQDTRAWTPAQHDAVAREIALYKEKLRPLIRDAALFHVSQRPDGVHWDGIEYWDAARGQGVVYAFCGSVADEPKHLFVLKGLKGNARYRIHFQDGSGPDREATGSELMGQGLWVGLEHPLSSELVFVEERAHGSR